MPELVPTRPIAIDLFAGAGGMTLGFEMAGFDIPVAVEFDPIHCLVHEYNFPHTRVLCRSVADVGGNEIRHALAAQGDRDPEADIDVLFGGPPCQGFSTMGKRSLDDPRNGLALHFLRLAFELRPKYFVMENVRGMTQGKHRGFIDELIALASANGYRIRSPYQVLNAARYGVPQDRDRLFLLGTRGDCAPPTYPPPQTRFPDGHRRGKRDDRTLPVAPTVWDAIADLPAIEPHEQLFSRDRLERPAYGTPISTYARRCRGLDRAPEDFSYPRQGRHDLLSGCGRTHHNATSRRRFADTPPGTVEPISRFRRLAPQGLCNTLRAGTPSSRGAFTSPRPIHPHLPRCITVREAARLHGYPDWFSFHGTKWHGMRQIGNSVPPPLAQAVAATLHTQLRDRPVRPTEPVLLPDLECLGLPMTAAADHYAVDPHTIAPRQRLGDVGLDAAAAIAP